MKKIVSLLAAVAVLSVSCAEQAKQESMEELTARVFERAAVQLSVLDTHLDSVAAMKCTLVL